MRAAHGSLPCYRQTSQTSWADARPIQSILDRTCVAIACLYNSLFNVEIIITIGITKSVYLRAGPGTNLLRRTFQFVREMLVIQLRQNRMGDGM